MSRIVILDENEFSITTKSCSDKEIEEMINSKLQTNNGLNNFTAEIDTDNTIRFVCEIVKEIKTKKDLLNNKNCYLPMFLLLFPKLFETKECEAYSDQHFLTFEFIMKTKMISI